MSEFEDLMEIICSPKQCNIEQLKQFNEIIGKRTVKSLVVKYLQKLINATLKYAFHESANYRDLAIPTFIELANLLDMNKHLKEDLWWRSTKSYILEHVDSLMELVVSGDHMWSELWCAIILLLGTDLRGELRLLNKLLKVVEKAFKMSNEEVRYKGFHCWRVLIDNFAINRQDINNNKKRLILLVIPLKANNHNSNRLCAAKMLTWKHLLSKLDKHNETTVQELISHFLQFMFIGINNISPACKIFSKDCADIFLQLLKAPGVFQVLPEQFVKQGFICIEHIYEDSSLSLKIWESLIDNVAQLHWPENLVSTLLNCLIKSNHNEKFVKNSTYSRIVHSLYSGNHKLPENELATNIKTIISLVLEPHVLVHFSENWCNEMFDMIAKTEPLLLPQSIVQDAIMKLNVLSTSEMFRDDKLKLLRSIWVSLTNLLCKWMSERCQLSKDESVQSVIQNIHSLLIFGAAQLSSMWNKFQMKSWKNLYCECVKSFSILPDVQSDDFIKDLVGLIFNEVENTQIPLHVAVDIVIIVFESHLPKDASIILPLMKKIGEIGINSLQNDVSGTSALINHYLKSIVIAARSEPSLVNEILTVTDKMFRDLEAYPSNTFDKIRNMVLKAQHQLQALKPTRLPDKSESPTNGYSQTASSSPTVTSFLHRLAKAKETKAKMVSPTSSKSSEVCRSPNHTPNSKRNCTSLADLKSEEFVFIPPKSRKTILTDHQKESLSTRKHDIPALYQDLSQDSSQSALESIVTSVQPDEDVENVKAIQSPKKNHSFELKLKGMTQKTTLNANVKNMSDNQTVTLHNKENNCLKNNNNTSSPFSSVKQQEKCSSKENVASEKDIHKESNLHENSDCSKSLGRKGNLEPMNLRSRKSFSGCLNDDVNSQTVTKKCLDSVSSSPSKKTSSIDRKNSVDVNEKVAEIELSNSKKHDLSLNEPPNNSEENHTNEMNTPKRRMKRNKLIISITKNKNDKKFDDIVGKQDSNNSIKNNSKKSPPKTSPRRLRKRNSGVTPILSGGKQHNKNRQLSSSTPISSNTNRSKNNSTKKGSASEETNIECSDIGKENNMPCGNLSDIIGLDDKEDENMSPLSDNYCDIIKNKPRKNQSVDQTTLSTNAVLSHTPLELNNDYSNSVETNILKHNLNHTFTCDNSIEKTPVRDLVENKPKSRNEIEQIREPTPDEDLGKCAVIPESDECILVDDEQSKLVELNKVSGINLMFNEHNTNFSLKKMPHVIDTNTVNRCTTIESNKREHIIQTMNDAIIKETEGIQLNSKSTVDATEVLVESEIVKKSPKSPISNNKCESVDDINKHSSPKDNMEIEKNDQSIYNIVSSVCNSVKEPKELSEDEYSSSIISVNCVKPSTETNKKAPNYENIDIAFDHNKGTIQNKDDCFLKNIKSKNASNVLNEFKSNGIRSDSCSDISSKCAEESCTSIKNMKDDKIVTNNNSSTKSLFNSVITDDISNSGLSTNESEGTKKDKINTTNQNDDKLMKGDENVKTLTSKEIKIIEENIVSKPVEKSCKVNNMLGEHIVENEQESITRQSALTPKNNKCIIDKNKKIDLKTDENISLKYAAYSPKDENSKSNKDIIENGISKEILKPGSTPLKSCQKNFKQTQLPFTPIQKSENKISQSVSDNSTINSNNQPFVLIERLNSHSLDSKSEGRQEVPRTPDKTKSPLNTQGNNVSSTELSIKTTESEDIIESSQDDNISLHSSSIFSGGHNPLKLLRKSPKNIETDSVNQASINGGRTLRSSPLKVDFIRLSGTPVKKSVCRRLDVEIDCKPLEVTSNLEDVLNRPTSPLIIDDMKKETLIDSNTPKHSEEFIDEIKIINKDNQIINSQSSNVLLEQNENKEKSETHTKGGEENQGDNVITAITSPVSYKGLKRMMQDPEFTCVESPNRSRISLKLEAGSPKSPSSRTNQMVELAMQDKEKTIHSPVNAMKRRRINPFRLGSAHKSPANSSAIIQRTHNGPSEEWVRRTYSPQASPNSSILKRKCDLASVSPDSSPPSLKKKRVSFLDPPVSESLLFSKKNPGKGHVQRPEPKKETESEDIESQGSAPLLVTTSEQSHSKVFSPLKQCLNPLTDIIERIVSSQWASELEAQLERLSVTTVGELSSLTEATIERLPFIPPKVERLKKILQNYYNEINEKPEMRKAEENILGCEELITTPSDENKEFIKPKDTVEELPTQLQFDELIPSEENLSSVVEQIKRKMEVYPALITELIQQLDLDTDTIVSVINCAVQKLDTDTIVSVINCAVQKLKSKAEQR